MRQNVSVSWAIQVFTPSFLLLFSALSVWARVPVVLSTDVGNEIDDQWAVAYLLSEPAFEVRGILSAYAPSLPDPSAHSSLLILRDVVERRVGLREHPPLVEGASAPLESAQRPQLSSAAQFLVTESRGFSAANRLTVLTIGAATDVASALLIDPAMADRVRVVAMAFRDLRKGGAHEFNEMNDPRAWQVLLRSRVPVVVGTAEVCRAAFSLNYSEAEHLLQGHGPLAAWLWEDYRGWYFRNVKPLRVADYSKPWVIWDLITLAYVRGLAIAQETARPDLDDVSEFQPGQNAAPFATVTKVDSAGVWREFLADLDRFQQAHAVAPAPDR